jgi:hypothetical protein
MELIDYIFADCDGWVVNATMTIGRTELDQMASQAPWNWTTDYPGDDSPDGCGATSNYSVDYQVYATSLEVTVPNVLEKSPKEATQILTAAGFTFETHFGKANVDMPEVLTQDPGPGAILPGPLPIGVTLGVGVPEGGKHPLP